MDHLIDQLVQSRKSQKLQDRYPLHHKIIPSVGLPSTTMSPPTGKRVGLLHEPTTLKHAKKYTPQAVGLPTTMSPPTEERVGFLRELLALMHSKRLATQVSSHRPIWSRWASR